MPPPAAATQSRQGAPEGAEALPQLGSIASAVTRPDSWVDGPLCVVGSKNCPASPGTSVVAGPSASQAPGVADDAFWYAAPDLKAERLSRCGLASNAWRAPIARRSSTYERGIARLSTCSAAGFCGPLRSASPVELSNFASLRGST